VNARVRKPSVQQDCGMIQRESGMPGGMGHDLAESRYGEAFFLCPDVAHRTAISGARGEGDLSPDLHDEWGRG
jgi:hypothetical protein